MGMWAIQNPPDVTEWLQKGGNKIKLTETEKQTERIMMGIRLRQEGCPIAGISQQAIDKAIQYGWAHEENRKLIPTRTGILMLNQLTLLLIP
jgi:coproporphyrinogen III oxidase-like Fe-S oxidoreductase